MSAAGLSGPKSTCSLAGLAWHALHSFVAGPSCSGANSGWLNAFRSDAKLPLSSTGRTAFRPLRRDSGFPLAGGTTRRSSVTGRFLCLDSGGPISAGESLSLLLAQTALWVRCTAEHPVSCIRPMQGKPGQWRVHSTNSSSSERISSLPPPTDRPIMELCKATVITLTGSPWGSRCCCRSLVRSSIAA